MNPTPETVASESTSDSRTDSIYRVMKRVLWVLVSAWALLVLVWSSLHLFIVPRIDDFRPALQRQASHTLGLRVEIDKVSVLGGWWTPQLRIQDVQIFDTQGREALRLPQVDVVVSARSLLRGKFEQLVIDQPELDIRRDTQGHIWVAGIDTTQSSDGSGPDWFFSQPEFLIRDGVLHWRDEMRDSPELSLSHVNVVMQNSLYQHLLRIDVTPPVALGQRLSVQGKFSQNPLQRSGDLRLWSGELFANAPDVDLSSLRQWLRFDKGIAVYEGKGGVRVWTDWVQGQLIGITADLALDAVDARLGDSLKPLVLRHVSGRIGAKWLDGENEINSQDLVFDTQEGERWPGGVLRLNWHGDDFHAGNLTADRLDLDALAQISQRLPLPEDLRTVLKHAQPKGQVNQLTANWMRPSAQQADAEFSYKAKGTVHNLQWLQDANSPAPYHRLPGVAGADVDFDVSQQGGKVQMVIKQGGVTLPEGLDEPKIALTEAAANISWQIKPADKKNPAEKEPEIAVQFKQARLRNADATAELSGTWTTGKGENRWPGELDITANISRAQIKQVHRYLPIYIDAEARAYLRDALIGGEATQASLRLRGNLTDMPFDNPKLGEFRVVAQIANGQYAYVPPVKGKPTNLANTWPAIASLNGELVYDRSALTFKGAGKLAGAPQLAWDKIEATLPNVKALDVTVKAQARGPLADMQTLVARSALNDLLNRTLEKGQATGMAEFKMQLNVPVRALQKTSVQGSVTLQDNDVQIMPGVPVLNKARGVVQFDTQGLTTKNLKARVFGGEAQIDGGLSFDPNKTEVSDQLRIKGVVTAEGLRQAGELGVFSRLALRANGSTSYAATVALRKGQPEILVQSDLKGMALTLPAPMNKPAATSWPLRVETQLTKDSLAPKSKVMQDQIKLSVARVLSLNYVRDVSSAQTRVLRGAIALGVFTTEATPSRDAGVSLSLQQANVDLDAWNEVMTQLTATSANKSKPRSTKTSLVGQEMESTGAPDYMPSLLTVRADQVKLADRFINRVVVGGVRMGELWRLNIAADELNGTAEVRPATTTQPAQLYARLSFLNIPPSAVPDVERMLSDEPSSIPALDVVVNDLTLRGKKLGRLEMDAVNRTTANAGREWRLNKLNLSAPDGTLSAAGSWAADGPKLRRTRLDFVMDIKDSGQLLTRLGTPNAIRNGHGKLQGKVSWQGSPITLDYPSMSGQLNLMIEKGQFLKSEPGAARLLGVLSLQALPRRLMLDFSDVFGEGFAFDFVRGDVRIEQGVASTNNLQMKGVSAGAAIEGSADIAKETQNLKVVVVPEINTSAATLYMAAINPLVGLTTYLSQLVLSKPLTKAGTSVFLIDGPWSNPRVTKSE